MYQTTVFKQIAEFLLIPLLGLVGACFLSWLKMKKQELLAKTEDEKAKKYIEMLDNTITDCVLATNQTYVEALKKDGAFTAEAQKAAFQMTFDAVMAILTEDAQEYLNSAVNDLTACITNKIEAQVSLTKTSGNN